MEPKKYGKELLLSLLEQMFLIRVVEDSLVDPILKKDIGCPCHLCTGQEAVAVGIAAHLKKEDYLFGNHRSHGHYLAKGGDLKKMIAEIYCRQAGCAKGRGGSMHLIDTSVGIYGTAPIVGGTISLSLGAAMASKANRYGRVSVSFFGDGATGEGVLFEALNFASLKNLPIIFVCENNLYSTHLPIDEIRKNSIISKISDPFDLKSYRVDGNDILEVYDVAEESVRYAREKGPVLIEALTYRQRGHVGPDDNIQGTHSDIRPPEELKNWLEKDPINMLEKHLLEHFNLHQNDLMPMKTRIKNLVHEVHIWAKSQVFPQKEELSHHVFR